MSRAKEKASRKAGQKSGKSSKKGGDEGSEPNVHYKLNLGEHAHILTEIENILAASDHADDYDEDGEPILSDEDLLQELRDMVESSSS